MIEIRKDLPKNEWAIIAPVRGDRPFDFSSEDKDNEKTSKDCPFCPGNEDQTPPEVYAVRAGDQSDGSDWKVRVFPNKYPALDQDGTSSTIEGDLFQSLGGFGFHEVIAETPEHEINLEDLEEERIGLVIDTYLERRKELGKNTEIKYVSIFRNKGKRAGASLAHPHSQILATTFVPRIPRIEYHQTESFHRKTGDCFYCRLIEAEKREARRVILENEEFIAISPFWSRFPFETHIIPKEHESDFGASTGKEISGLAKSLKRTLTSLRSELGDFPYNYSIHTTPVSEKENDPKLKESYHWHLEIFPRLTNPAGFEWGSGNFINVLSPEEATKRLRSNLD